MGISDGGFVVSISDQQFSQKLATVLNPSQTMLG